MDAEEITKLCKSLSIFKEEEEVVVLDRSLIDIGVREINNSLVGKVLANKVVNKDALRTVINQVWKTLNGVKVESVGSNLFLFHFSSKSDRKRVLTGSPWCFDKTLIVLSESKGIGELSKLDFSFTSFWVQIHNIPIFCMTK